MNAIPLVTVAPIQRPEFDNTNLGKPLPWAQDNAAPLARYWRDQGNVLGLAP